jgi:hypothetical protein
LQHHKIEGEKKTKKQNKTKLIPTPGLEDLIVYGNLNKFITQLVSRLSVPCFKCIVPLRVGRCCNRNRRKERTHKSNVGNV